MVSPDMLKNIIQIYAYTVCRLRATKRESGFGKSRASGRCLC